MGLATFLIVWALVSLPLALFVGKALRGGA